MASNPEASDLTGAVRNRTSQNWYNRLFTSRTLYKSPHVSAYSPTHTAVQGLPGSPPSSSTTQPHTSFPSFCPEFRVMGDNG